LVVEQASYVIQKLFTISIDISARFLYIAAMACSLLFFCSCSSLRSGLYLSFIDKKNTGDSILAQEINVKEYLNKIIMEADRYTIKAYERTALNHQIKKTKLMVHSFYVISDSEGEYHTLSFYGTDINFYSEGAWVMDSYSDRYAYNMYKEGKNKKDVEEIKIGKGIEVDETVKAIKRKIESEVRYYYRDHIKDRDDVDNCNTALYETAVEKK
jgi:hypothetical protein